MSNIFDNRELSFLVWLIIAIGLMMLKPSIRNDVFKLIQTAFDKKLVIIYLWMISYIGLIIYVLFKISLWNTGQIKNTVMWIFFTGIGTLLKVNTVGENKNFFKDALKDVFCFTTIVAFLVGFYTFNFWIEFTIFPILTILVGTLVFAERDKKYEAVKKFLNSILSLVGLSLIGYAIYKLITSFEVFATRGTLSDFLIPPVLSLSFLPFIYLLSVIMRYETNFIRLKFALKDPTLEKFARKEAFIQFGFKIKDLERWATSLFRIPLTSKEDITASISEIKRLKRIEKNPPEIAINIGWSPYKAKAFLIGEGIETGHYRDTGEDEWMACSNYVQLNDAILSNNISYYVEGNNQVANKLKLSLAVHSPEAAEAAHLILLSAATVLYCSALGKSLPSEIERAIKLGLNKKAVEGSKKITVAKNNWPGHKLNGYEMEFKIEV